MKTFCLYLKFLMNYVQQVFSDEEGAEEGGSEVEEDLEGPVSTQGFSAPSAAVNGSAHPPEPEPTPPAAPQTPVTPQVPTPVPVRKLQVWWRKKIK